MKKFIFLIVILIILFSGIYGLSARSYGKQRVFLIEEKILLKNLPEDITNLQIWIPAPIDDKWQKIDDFKVVSPFDFRIITDKKYGNRIIYLKPKKIDLATSTSQIILSFKAQRKEYSASFDDPVAEESLSGFLQPNRLVPINGKIKALARKITQGKSNDLERVRAIYDYIINELTYSKDDPQVCGLGNSLLTLEFKKGICTDYHSLFISLVRSLGIPAKFEIGLPIPIDKEEGVIKGYHCWAKFYLKDKGWIPVDISEADKHPEKRDYFFGQIDENRVHFTTGRDIKLKYAKDSEPLNFFIYPYAEFNGWQFNNLDFEISFKDFKGGGN
ncbi:MAG: transglutaminase domain-containing protein [Omnitrophica bacterium]|nr:transglutaminase domain-containing protein [Candidatus Omnitrophota bacterium]